MARLAAAVEEQDRWRVLVAVEVGRQLHPVTSQPDGSGCQELGHPGQRSDASTVGCDATRCSLMPLFELDGDRVVPTGLTRGPWDPTAMNGGAVAALVA